MQPALIPRHHHPLQPGLRIITTVPLVENRDAKPAPHCTPRTATEIANRRQAYPTAGDRTERDIYAMGQDFFYKIAAK